jgi:hypothetical protein
LLRIDKMCFTCSTLVNYHPESVEQTKNDFTECSKFLYVTPPEIIVDPDFTLEKAREFFKETEKDYLTFIKAHYLYGGSYRPYNIKTEEFFKYADKFDDVVNIDGGKDKQTFFVTRCAFVAHYKLRLATLHLIDVLERIAEKKRKRRLQYKINKRALEAQPQSKQA